MLEVLAWLKGTEEMARDFYRGAVAKSENPTLKRFLKQLADDEQGHADLLASLASELPGRNLQSVMEYRLDDVAKEGIRRLGRDAQALLKADDLPERALYDAITEIEFGEYNHIFMYAVRLCEQSGLEYQRGLACLQRHLERIKCYFSALPESLQPARPLSDLPAVWKKKMLLVDDSHLFREALAGLLQNKGRVEQAANGAEALEKLQREFYDLIITDMRMPGMTGLELYRNALAFDARFKGHFIFMSFDFAPDAIAFLQENALPHFCKPLDIGIFLQAIDRMVPAD